MAAPIGTWNINANGFSGTLSIQQVDAQGNLSASSVFGNDILGFWDESSQKLTFIRLSNPALPSTFQIYTGYLMPPQPDTILALAGSFEAFPGTGGTAQQSLFGWFATIQ